MNIIQEETAICMFNLVTLGCMKSAINMGIKFHNRLPVKIQKFKYFNINLNTFSLNNSFV